MFDYLQANAPMGERFNEHMGGYAVGRPSWHDKAVYPVQQRLIDGFVDGNSAVMLVDIGGSVGHNLDEFRRKFPNAPGRLVLEDLAVVLSQIKELHGRIERVTYDFMTEQPVQGTLVRRTLQCLLHATETLRSRLIDCLGGGQGARAYYMHSVLHDWPDDECVKIVERVKAAMSPGYSRLLVNEQVIPATGAHWEATYVDIVMMCLFSSKERTEAQWRYLLEDRCGFDICNIWFGGSGVESVIECELR
jgi:hypothetical protein